MKAIDYTKKYLLAVSGGVDSMVMLTMFCKLNPRPSFSVMTVNHNIRPEAQRDCDFVAEYCCRADVPCRVVSVDVPTYAKEHHVSEEAAARVLRYERLNDTDADYICLAHHADDNAETVLMHILRGSGGDGAVGMRTFNGRYFRPLIDYTREEIMQYARENDVPFVEDATNAETHYTRNYIRHCVMPTLNRVNANARGNLLRFAQNEACDNDCLDELADISAVCFKDGEAALPMNILGAHRAIVARIFRKTLFALGATTDVEKSHIDALIALVGASGGKCVCLPYGLVAINDYDKITIKHANNTSLTNESGAYKSFCVPFAFGVTFLPNGKLVVSDKPTEGSLRINPQALPQNTVVRFRREGDNFAKFGSGTKSLKKFFVDQKIPQRLRDSIPLIAGGSEVFVVCGVEISEKVKVTDDGAWYINFYMEGNNNAAR